MLPMLGMKVETLKLPEDVINHFRTTAKQLGVTRSFLEREFMIDAAERMRAGRWTKRLRVILDIENSRRESPVPESESLGRC